MAISPGGDWGPYVDEKTAASTSYAMVRALRPTWSQSAVLIATAIGYAESRFGVTPDWRMPDGSPSWNWGATVGTGSAGSIDHADHDKDGKPVVYHFSAWTSAVEGFEFWATRWPAVSQAQSGTAREVAKAMYDAHWFTGTKGSDDDRIDSYARVIDGAARHVATLLRSEGVNDDVKLGVKKSGGSSTSSGGGLLVLFVLWALSRR